MGRWAVTVGLAVLALPMLAYTPSAGPRAPTDAYPKNPDIDVAAYSFRLALRDDTDRIEGETTIQARLVSDGIAELRLDLANATPAREGKGMTVTSVTARDSALSYEHEGDVLTIALPRPSRWVSFLPRWS